MKWRAIRCSPGRSRLPSIDTSGTTGATSAPRTVSRTIRRSRSARGCWPHTRPVEAQSGSSPNGIGASRRSYSRANTDGEAGAHGSGLRPVGANKTVNKAEPARGEAPDGPFVFWMLQFSGHPSDIGRTSARRPAYAAAR